MNSNPFYFFLCKSLFRHISQSMHWDETDGCGSVDKCWCGPIQSGRNMFSGIFFTTIFTEDERERKTAKNGPPKYKRGYVTDSLNLWLMS